MNTPIADFVQDYGKQNKVRLHMPGHKGKSFLGWEQYDLTEVTGADALYEADGMIAESEKNAGNLFGSGATYYSTEGSSQCIRAMLYLALTCRSETCSPVIVAGRNVHKSFVHAAALMDAKVEWIYPEEETSLCSCPISPKQLEQVLNSMSMPPVAVYLTSPDYLGEMQDIKALAEICHKYGTWLLVDNAHGAYLKFLEPSLHTLDLGADMCCDSAHKTLPVLTGGAYLHINHSITSAFQATQVKNALALFGSTSPSYLTLASLDLCNAYLADGYKEKLKATIANIEKLKAQLENQGWNIIKTDPLKLTIKMLCGLSGKELLKKLSMADIECEYADDEYLVCMLTPENGEEDYRRLAEVLDDAILSTNIHRCKNNCVNPFTETENDAGRLEEDVAGADACEMSRKNQVAATRKSMSIREALFAPQEVIPVEEALGRICGSPTVSCPPAIPIAVSGEQIDEKMIDTFKKYGIENVSVVK